MTRKKGSFRIVGLIIGVLLIFSGLFCMAAGVLGTETDAEIVSSQRVFSEFENMMRGDRLYAVNYLFELGDKSYSGGGLERVPSGGDEIKDSVRIVYFVFMPAVNLLAGGCGITLRNIIATGLGALLVCFSYERKRTGNHG